MATQVWSAEDVSLSHMLLNMVLLQQPVDVMGYWSEAIEQRLSCVRVLIRGHIASEADWDTIRVPAGMEPRSVLGEELPCSMCRTRACLHQTSVAQCGRQACEQWTDQGLDSCVSIPLHTSTHDAMGCVVLTLFCRRKTQSDVLLYVQSWLPLLRLLWVVSRFLPEQSEIVPLLDRSLPERLRNYQQVYHEICQTRLSVAALTHELGTPLGNTQLALEHVDEQWSMVQERTQQNRLGRSDFLACLGEVREGLELMKRNLRRARQLFQSFRHISADQANERLRLFSIQELVVDHWTLFQASLRGIVLNLQLSVTPDSLEMYGYPGLLGQILTNLFNNARHHAFRDRTTGSISIDVHPVPDDRIVICFTDDGAGMRPEQVEHAFDPFYTTAETQGGTGLGLYLIRRWVSHDLDGEISLQSTWGQGSSITMILPRQLDHT